MPHLNDRDILSDFLKDAKFKSQAYHVATVESTNDSVRDTCLRFMNEELQNHKAIFNTMSSRGWYQVESANQNPSHFQTGGRQTHTPNTLQEPGPNVGYGAFRYDDQQQQSRPTGYERFEPRYRD